MRLPRLLPALTLLALHLAAAPPCVADAQGLTLSYCTRATDCHAGHHCLVAEESALCPDDGRVAICFCMPTNAISIATCSMHGDCPRGELCASHAELPDAQCVDCTVVRDDTRGFIPMEDPETRCSNISIAATTTLPSPPPPASKEPPADPAVNDSKPLPPTGLLRHAFCEPDMPCAQNLTCNEVGRASFCLADSVACTCTSNRTTTCGGVDDDKCASGATCVLNINSNRTSCVACSFARTSLYVLASSGCGKGTPRPLPSYAASPNGLSFEPCRSNLSCAEPYRCREASGFECAEIGDPCMCLPDGGVQTSCSRSDDCPDGEVCIKQPGIDDTCYSAAAFATMRARNLTVTELAPRRKRPSPLAKGDGLSYSACRFDWHCVNGHRCTHIEDVIGGCAGRRACTCKPLRPLRCTSTGQCAKGAVCANFVGAKSRAFCIATDAASADPSILSVAQLRAAEKKPLSPTPLPGTGLTLEPCHTTEDCEGARVCRHTTESFDGCLGRAGCFCYTEQPASCEAEEECQQGEVCVSYPDAVHTRGFCLSTYALQAQEPNLYLRVELTEQPSSEGDKDDDPNSSAEGDAAVCIARHALRQFAAHHLVFARSRLATVLCDGDMNCATRGHIVVWQGTAMMMQSYCARRRGDGLVGCTRRRMWVNSPRMRRGLRVASRSKGLQFTALAARFETIVEEHVLSGLVRLGL